MEARRGAVLDGTGTQAGSGNAPRWAGENAARLARSIEEEVLKSTHSAVRNLSVHLTPREVILRGWCRSYHVKQVAQHAAMRVCEDLDVTNEIQVID
jgi:osmotically-inducible protein OsmY